MESAGDCMNLSEQLTVIQNTFEQLSAQLQEMQTQVANGCANSSHLLFQRIKIQTEADKHYNSSMKKAITFVLPISAASMTADVFSVWRY